MSDRQAAWAFNQPSLATLRASEKKVFAHYFPAHPIRINNLDPELDYWSAQYLNPAGEPNGTFPNGKWYAQGGFVRQRPLPQQVSTDPNWELRDMELDVQRAVALGLDGFIWDLLSTAAPYPTRLTNMLQAAQNVDPNFKIILAPDNDDVSGMMTYIQQFYSSPALYKLDDGRVLVEPYRPERTTAATWEAALTSSINAGYPTALLPIFVDNDTFDNGETHANYDSFVYGKSWWDTGASSKIATITALHNAGKVFEASFAPQVNRPKNLLFREAEGSKGYRQRWDSVIQSDTDMVQLVTWNDYTEDTVISPSTGIGYAFYDLTAYYVSWYKTGVEPTLVRDQIQYYHRQESKDAVPDLAKQSSAFTTQIGTGAAQNVIELLAFLSTPGRVEITIGNQTSGQDFSAGLHTFVSTSYATGVTPIFRLVRNSTTEIELTSAWPIKTDAEVLAYGWQDMGYKAGSSIPSPDISLIKSSNVSIPDAQGVTVVARDANDAVVATTSQAYIASGKLRIADQSFLEKLDDDQASYKFKVKVPGYLAKLTATAANPLSGSHQDVSVIAGDMTNDNAVSLGDIIATIRALNGSSDAQALVAQNVFGGVPSYANLISVIRALNETPEGDQ